MFKNSLELLKCDIHNGATGKLIDPGRCHFQTHRNRNTRHSHKQQITRAHTDANYVGTVVNSTG